MPEHQIVPFACEAEFHRGAVEKFDFHSSRGIVLGSRADAMVIPKDGKGKLDNAAEVPASVCDTDAFKVMVSRYNLRVA